MSLNLLRGEMFHRKRRPPVDVVVTAGYARGEKGVPSNKDRFYILQPYTSRTVKRGASTGGAREFKRGKAFDAWNKNGSGGFPQLACRFHHAAIEDALSVGLKAHTAPRDIRRQRGWQPPPAQRPWCSSEDGETRSRWNGEEWERGPCPGGACPYMADRDCKPIGRLVFTLDMPDFGMPEVSAYLETHSPKTIGLWKSWLLEMEEQWAELLKVRNLPNIPIQLIGFPIRLENMYGKRKFAKAKRDRNGNEVAWGEWPEIKITSAITLDKWLDQTIASAQDMHDRIRLLASGSPGATDVSKELSPHGATLMTGARVLAPPPSVIDERPDPALLQCEVDPDGYPVCPACAGQTNWNGSAYVCATGCAIRLDERGRNVE